MPTGPFNDFEEIFTARIRETDEFYAELQRDITDEDERRVQRQAFAGMFWSKQLYYYNVEQWLKGDPHQPPPPAGAMEGQESGVDTSEEQQYHFDAG